jgi:hypothetical protein
MFIRHYQSNGNSITDNDNDHMTSSRKHASHACMTREIDTGGNRKKNFKGQGRVRNKKIGMGWKLTSGRLLCQLV